MKIQERLMSLQDESYANFQSKLIPTVAREKIIGVRVPQVRKLAKELLREGDYKEFLDQLPHTYYDEDMLHGLLLSELKDYTLCIRRIEQFLPYVDNWAVCDCMSPKVFRKNKDSLLDKIREWTVSEDTYTCRFGVGMLMTHFLEEDFEPEYLEMVACIQSEEYYVNMMRAWFYATALARQWEATIAVLATGRLDIWTHNKTIQKARESFRITAEQKEQLKTMKR